ncbi:saccharopine dehydrogenase [Sulfitobacter sp. SK012]|uniref:saccharopine dehydrogenase n=1 Tax=Sulfitobacter sp. SK012 TaxID=1389005 RepID=UPI000E0BD139|nr:saccharopine dehydrogenase [Sulfitobacter sp. SK012]AXI48236.1 saccharopine dehydrogenase [Sulfitobacter sp. SK012]
MSAPHIWLRAEQRANETRTGLTPQGAATLRDAGFEVSVEATDSRVIDTQAYAAAGCTVVAAGSWPDAPKDAVIFGLKELPDDGTPLRHRHIMFGHAYKGQTAGQILLRRFKAGCGTLLDLEYLTNGDGRRVAAFGYWAGFAGAAMAIKCWIAQQDGSICGPVASYPDATALKADLRADLSSLGTTMPDALIIGALGRVGAGAADLCEALGVSVTKWDMEETAKGGPFPEILAHALFFNCILARESTPVFVPSTAMDQSRNLRVIGDIACDPDSAFNPVPVYDRATSWDAPALRVHQTPPLDVMAIDNLPSLLPLESSEDFAAQLLPTLVQLAQTHADVWSRADTLYHQHSATL